jgi:hypothetical protein
MCSYDYLGNIAGTQAPGSTGQGCTGSFTEQAPGNACNPKLTDSAAVHVPLAIAHGVYEDTSAIVCSGTTMLAGCQDAPCHGTQGWNQLGCVGFHVANLALLAIPETRVIEATAERSILMDAEVGTRVGLGSGPKFHSVYEDGVRVLEGRQPARFGSLSGDPGAVGAHTRLRWDMDNGRIYAGREFNDLGQPVRDIDFTRPTFPSGLPRPNHFVPEQHLWSVNDPAVGPRSGWVRGPGEPFGW